MYRLRVRSRAVRRRRIPPGRCNRALLTSNGRLNQAFDVEVYDSMIESRSVSCSVFEHGENIPYNLK